jgi:hypothetical protein
MSSIGMLVKAFVEVARDLRPEFIEAWLTQRQTENIVKITDYDMDIILIEEKKYRSHTYKKLVNEHPITSSGKGN